MMSTLGRAVRAWQRLQRDDFLRRPQNVYQYTWDAVRVSALVFGGYCGVKLAWELAYEAMPDAFRSAELAKASAVEMDRERANAWNDQEERPMSEREFLDGEPKPGPPGVSAPSVVAPSLNMGRLHGPGKGISSSALPYKRTAPSWFNKKASEIEDSVAKFARRGLRPSQIGVILRDSHGVAQVKAVTGAKILRLLKRRGLAPELPEDLYHLIKKAVSVRKHLESNRKDKDSKFRLILIESRIHRLARYYKRTRQLTPNWKYDSATASTLVA